MRSRQRKPIVVVLDILVGDLPSAHCVTLLAIRTQLPLVNVSVAVLAPLSDVGKDRFHVALCASHRCVHPAQRIARLVVIELGYCPDGFPGIRGVTILTGYIEVAVRTMRTRHLCLSIS
jgi:hypothetical protein